MPTLQPTDSAPVSDPAQGRSRAGSLERSLDRIAPMLMRAAAETSAAFLSVPAALSSAREAPRFSIPDALHCSQMNMGDKHQFLFNLSVDRPQWNRLFADPMPDSMKSDAYCELANCICGAILADASFMDEFGSMIPCVPCNGASRPEADAPIRSGTMILGGALIRFTFAIREIDPA